MKNKIKYLIVLLPMFFLGCAGFKFQGTMCDSMQPGQVSTECHAYSEEEAEEASTTQTTKAGECIDCDESKPVEVNRNRKK